MAKLYGFGASIVIVGALFKIQHWPGAGIMLTAGLLTEAIIFFFSAFEPLHEDVDWTLVYPELAGLTEDDMIDEPTKQKSKASTAVERFDELLEKAEAGPGLFEKLGKGLNNLSTTTQKLAEISDASIATNEYVNNMKDASVAATGLTEAYQETAKSINESAGGLAQSYMQASEVVSQSGQSVSDLISKSGNEVAEIISKSGNELAQSYSNLANTINKDLESVDSSNQAFGEQLESVTKSLTALNSAYELQLQNVTDQFNASKDMMGGLDEMMTSLNASVEDTKRYKEQISQLTTNLSALNNVYGNMLSAMNMNVNNQNNQ